MTADDILKNAIFAGEIMLSNGAETNRVEDTMRRILGSYNNSHAETFVTVTGIFASIETEEHGLVTAVKRIKNRTIHLGKVAQVNDLSRRFVNGKVAPEELYAELESIDNGQAYPAFMRVFFVGIASGCFAYMFGGDVRSGINAAIIVWISNSLVTYLNSRRVSGVIVNLTGSILLTVLALIFFTLEQNTRAGLDKTIIGAIMPMVPGIALTNAIRDIVEGDFLSGASRITDALLIAVSIAAGVGTAFTVWIYLWGGI